MKRLALSLALIAVAVSTNVFSAQPAQAKSVGEILESAYNAVRRQTNPTTGYGNLYGNFYGAPYGYPYGYTTAPSNTSWLNSLSSKYLGTGETGQYIYDPYTGQYILNPNYTGKRSITSTVRGAIVKQIINRIF